MTYETAYSIHPTLADIDRDLADVTDATLERYNRDLDQVQVRALPWERLPLDQRRAVRASNELTKRQRHQQLAADKAARQQQEAAQEAAAHQAVIDAYKVQVRAVWIGDQASFDAAWPTLLQQWQIDQACAGVDANRARILAHHGGL